MNNKAFSLIELMVAVGFSVMLLTGVYSFYNASSQVYSTGVSGQSLQDGANTVIRKIIDGQAESGTVYRLSTSYAFSIPVNNSGLLYFCQDYSVAIPCGTSDSTVRWYTLNSTKTSLLYYHLTSNQQGYDTIYTAPKGSTLSLRFLPAQYNSTTLPNVVEIDVALTETVPANLTNTRLSTSGTASTFVLLRNHQ